MRRAVLERIAPYLTPLVQVQVAAMKTTTLTAADAGADTTIKVGEPVDGPVLMVDREVVECG
jgi:hypothetical protein